MGNPLSKSNPRAELTPFERAIFQTLKFESNQVKKTLSLKFNLSKDQLDQLDRIMDVPADGVLDVASAEVPDLELSRQLDQLSDDGGIPE
jgi:hypothetical protein